MEPDRTHVRAMTDAMLAERPGEFFARLSSDPVFFFDSCLFTYNPRMERAAVPFVLWRYQREVVPWMQTNIMVDPHDFLVDKSRDMGITWKILGIMLFNWLFASDFNGLLGSWKEDYVDARGDKNTHFERIRFMIRRLPEPVFDRCLGRHGFDWRRHSALGRLVNPSTGGQLTGESCNDNFGRSGRFNAVWIDEFARIEPNLQKEIWLGIADETPCRIVTSTPRGRANLFAKLRFESAIRCKTLRWTLHPIKSRGLYYLARDGRKQPVSELKERHHLTGFYDRHKLRSPWYDFEDERRKANPSEMAQEVDIDYLTSGDPVFSPDWSKSHAARVVKPRYRLQPHVTWPLEGPPAVTWSLWPNDGCLWVWAGRPRGRSVYCIGVDTSEGLGDAESDPDYHALVVWDIEHNHVVSSLRTRELDPRDLAAVVADLTNRWKAFLTIERNGPGLAVISVLSGLLTGYDLNTEVFRPRRLEERSHRIGRQSGFKTTRESKPHLIELIRHWTNPEKSHLRDERLVNEYTLFSRLPGYKMGAPFGMHDDMVMALGQALVAVQQAIATVSRETLDELEIDKLIALQQAAEKGEDVHQDLKRLIE